MNITLYNAPISVNSLYRTYKNRVILSKRGRLYKRETKKYIEDALHDQNIDINSFVPIEGKIKVKIDVYTKTKRDYDIDNRCKSVIDCMKGVLFKDDTQIYELNVIKHIDHIEDKTYIYIDSIN